MRMRMRMQSGCKVNKVFWAWLVLSAISDRQSLSFNDRCFAVLFRGHRTRKGAGAVPRLAPSGTAPPRRLASAADRGAGADPIALLPCYIPTDRISPSSSCSATTCHRQTPPPSSVARFSCGRAVVSVAPSATRIHHRGCCRLCRGPPAPERAHGLARLQFAEFGAVGAGLAITRTPRCRVPYGGMSVVTASTVRARTGSRNGSGETMDRGPWGWAARVLSHDLGVAAASLVPGTHPHE